MSETDAPKTRVLMGVNGILAYDGRVQRAARTLGEWTPVILMGRASETRCEGLPCMVREVHSPRLRGPGIIRALCFVLAFLWQAMKAKPSVIHAHEVQMLIPGWIASRIASAKLVYDAHELFVPDDNGFRFFGHRMCYYAERLFVRRADLVIAANDARAAIMQAHYSLPTRPTVIRNIPASPPVPDNGKLQALELPPRNGTIRLLYQGAMNWERDLHLIVRTLRRLGDQYELLMVGGGPHLNALKQLADNIGVVSRVTFLGRVPNSMVSQITRQCSIGVVSYSFESLNQRYCAPNKVYEYAQAGVPMVATGQEGLRELVADTGIGAILERGGTDDETLDNYANAIRYVVQNREQCRLHIPPFLAQNDWIVEKAKLTNCVRELCHTGR